MDWAESQRFYPQLPPLANHRHNLNKIEYLIQTSTSSHPTILPPVQYTSKAVLPPITETRPSPRMTTMQVPKVKINIVSSTGSNSVEICKFDKYSAAWHPE